MTTFTTIPPLPESPYRGIESFRYIDQQIFSARDDEAWDLLSNYSDSSRSIALWGFGFGEVFADQCRSDSGSIERESHRQSLAHTTPAQQRDEN